MLPPDASTWWQEKQRLLAAAIFFGKAMSQDAPASKNIEPFTTAYFDGRF
ncbi:hypothetical protein [Dickeya lacustris]|uniref:Uncharacterized protein n=1 Tax=Dickeya lacustris TaxID=2259638 RepID=A0ABY8GAY1_9GAMM|nr:hypothetical protein [Dickeya lacustris]WFN57126.1 hypothetical protein O1Q98_07895 [Dickeya lacustris]